jgi:hypothetical protein
MPHLWRVSGAGVLVFTGVLAPVSVANDGRLAAARAACPTCCYETSSVCFVCGSKDCVTIVDSYTLLRSGPCQQPT